MMTILKWIKVKSNLSHTAQFQNQAASLSFHAHTPGHIVINEQTYTQPVLCQQDRILMPQAPNIQQINLNQLKQWQQTYQPELILIGTGTQSCTIPKTIESFCHSHQVAVEAMSTNLCIRTLVALQGELRALICLLTP